MAAAATGEEGADQKAAEAPARGLLSRRLLLAGALAAGLAPAALFAAAALRPNPAVVEIEIGGELVYHDFPDIIADLKGDGRRPRYVKLGIVVELPAEVRPRLEERMSAIIDALHAYLRERSAAELTGEKGADQVRGALSAIINEALAPDEAKAILFRQFILS